MSAELISSSINMLLNAYGESAFIVQRTGLLIARRLIYLQRLEVVN